MNWLRLYLLALVMQTGYPSTQYRLMHTVTSLSQNSCRGMMYSEMLEKSKSGVCAVGEVDGTMDPSGT